MNVFKKEKNKWKQEICYNITEETIFPYYICARALCKQLLFFWVGRHQTGMPLAFLQGWLQMRASTYTLQILHFRLHLILMGITWAEQKWRHSSVMCEQVLVANWENQEIHLQRMGGRGKHASEGLEKRIRTTHMAESLHFHLSCFVLTWVISGCLHSFMSIGIVTVSTSGRGHYSGLAIYSTCLEQEFKRQEIA